MTQIKFPHKQFLEDNKEILESHPLPDMLRKRILGFEELEEDLPHTTDEDHERLVEKLEKLSHELDEDLEEYFEDQLENNDEEDDEIEKKKEPEDEKKQEEGIEPQKPVSETDTLEASQTQGLSLEQAPIAEQEITHEEEHPITEESETNQIPEAEEITSAPEQTSEPTDEEILMSLLENKHLELHPNKLREKGFKGPLKERTILVGKVCMRRGKYDTCYTITLSKD